MTGSGAQQSHVQGASSPSKDTLNPPVEGSALGSITSRSNHSHSRPHRDNTDLSGPLTEGVFERMNAKEKDLITSKMGARQYPIPALWPKMTFARVYLKHGNNAEIREYARLQLEAAHVEQAFAASKVPKEGEISSDSECEEIRIPHRSYTAPHRKGPGVWNRVEPGMHQETTALGSLFEDIDHKRERTLTARVPFFSIIDPNVELRDFCTWYDSIRQLIISLTVVEANFVLLSRVPPAYVQNILHEEKLEVREMPNPTLARRIGAVAYQRANINPTARARYLCMGRNRIGDIFELLRRVIDLHYCTYHKPSPEVFVMSLFHAIQEYIPNRGQSKFNDAVYEEYPAVHLEMYPTAHDNFGPHAFGKKAKKEAKMPTSPLEISHYADFLQANAAIVCLEHDGPYCRVLAKKSTNEGGPQVVTNAANFVASVPQQSPRPRLQPNNNRSDVPATRPVDRSQRWCGTCKTTTHSEDDCYVLHPEIKDRRLKEIADKKKERTQGRLAAHQLKKSQRSPAEQSSRPLATATRGGYGRERGAPNQSGPSQPRQVVASPPPRSTTVNSVGAYELPDFHR